MIHFDNWHTKTPWATMGFYSIDSYDPLMSGTEKLIFIASFFWFLNWGTRVTSLAINALL